MTEGRACKCPERDKPLAVRNWTVKSWHPYKVYGPNASNYRDRLLLDVSCEACKGWVRNKNPKAPIWDVINKSPYNVGDRFEINLLERTALNIPDASVLFDSEDLEALGYESLVTVSNPDKPGGFYYSVVNKDQAAVSIDRAELTEFIYAQGYTWEKLTGEDLVALFTLCADQQFKTLDL